jgi:hypothetical protein
MSYRIQIEDEKIGQWNEAISTKTMKPLTYMTEQQAARAMVKFFLNSGMNLTARVVKIDGTGKVTS